MYVSLKTFFHIQHLDSVASYLPTGLHLVSTSKKMYRMSKRDTMEQDIRMERKVNIYNALVKSSPLFIFNNIQELSGSTKYIKWLQKVLNAYSTKAFDLIKWKTVWQPWVVCVIAGEECKVTASGGSSDPVKKVLTNFVLKQVIRRGHYLGTLRFTMFLTAVLSD